MLAANITSNTHKNTNFNAWNSIAPLVMSVFVTNCECCEVKNARRFCTQQLRLRANPNRNVDAKVKCFYTKKRTKRTHPCIDKKNHTQQIKKKAKKRNGKRNK